jgi:hypothetical protein
MRITAAHSTSCYFKQFEIGVTTISAVAELYAQAAVGAAWPLASLADGVLFTFLARRWTGTGGIQFLTMLDQLAAMYFGVRRYCVRHGTARATLSRSYMETMMRSLKTEELELVAGGDPGEAIDHARSLKNNGLGNGDQFAPGSSLPHNGAENNVSNGGLGDNDATGNPPGSGRFDVIPD